MRSLGVLLALAMAALGVSPSVDAADGALYTATYVEVTPPSEARAAALLRQYRDASRRDGGNLRIDVLQRIDRPNHFVILAAWRDQRAFETHAAAAAAQELRLNLEPLLASPNDERLHGGLSVGPMPATSPGGAIHAVTHVDVIPPRKDDGTALLAQLAGDSRRDAGNLAFDVLQQTSRPNHFTVVESWKDRQAFDAHGMAAHTRQFRGRLAPMSGALYDERLYVALN